MELIIKWQLIDKCYQYEQTHLQIPLHEHRRYFECLKHSSTFRGMRYSFHIIRIIFKLAEQLLLFQK
jgi:hypothetical protein